MDEVVENVDENDVVIGQQLKSVCHRDKILHRGAGVMCFSDSSFNKVLINKRSANKDRNPGNLCFPGGHLQPGEAYVDGAKREFEEEMFGGKQNNNLKFEELFKIKKFTDNDYEFITIFRVIYNGNFNPDLNEVESYYFEDINKLFEDSKNNPEMFTGTAVLMLSEYARRGL